MPTDQAAVCLDVGSTWTKAVLVRPDGGLAGFAEHPTTATDVLTGMDAAVRAVSAAGSGAEPELYACSSAGGGMRLAVIGHPVIYSPERVHARLYAGRSCEAPPIDEFDIESPGHPA